jgi:hypothetical protein
MQSDDIPIAMKKAVKKVIADNEKVNVAFENAQTVPLSNCNNGSSSRCVLVK